MPQTPSLFPGEGTPLSLLAKAITRSGHHCPSLTPHKLAFTSRHAVQHAVWRRTGYDTVFGPGRLHWTPSASIRRVSQLAARNDTQQLRRFHVNSLWFMTESIYRPPPPSQRRTLPSASRRDRRNGGGAVGFQTGRAAHGATIDERLASYMSSKNTVRRRHGFSSTRTLSSFLATAGDDDAILSSWPPALAARGDSSVTVAEAQNLAAGWLERHDVVDPHPSACELLAKAARFRSPQDMLANRPASSQADLNAAEWNRMRELCRQRASEHVPVQYLVGEWDFHRISLEMRPPTLIPRPETEELVEMVLSWLRNEDLDTARAVGSPAIAGGAVEGLRFLDVGSGTGAIGLALLNELPGATCIAIDAQESAVRLSRLNAERNGLQDRYECVHVDIDGFDRDGKHFANAFDFVVGNPPYIPRKDMADLPADVANHEDAVALDGGEDGLDIVRQIVARCPGLLKKDGSRQLWMEVDTSHPAAMEEWFRLGAGGSTDDVADSGSEVVECDSHGVTNFESRSDMSQRPRFVRLTFAEERTGAEGHVGR